MLIFIIISGKNSFICAFSYLTNRVSQYIIVVRQFWGEFMVIDLRKHFAEYNHKTELNEEFDFSDLEFSGVYPISTPVRITGEILSRTGIVTLSAEITVEYSATCDRCGEWAVNKYDIPVNYVLVTELAGEDDNDDILLLNDMKLDIEELTESEVVLNIPTKHLCREDCQGICQNCGKNLNEGPCGCVSEEIDPRLQVLKDLLENG